MTPPSGRVGGPFVIWSGIAVLTLYLLLIGGGWWGIYRPDLRLTSVVLMALVLGAWLVVAMRDPAWRPRSVLLPAIAAALGSLTISTLMSRDPRISAEYLGYSILLAALYLLLVRLLADPFFRPRLLALGAFAGVVIAAVYLVLVVSDWMDWWRALGHVTLPPLRPNAEALTYGNPSAVFTIVALLAVPAAGLLGFSSGRRRLGAVALACLVGIIALISGSRAGWLGLGGATVLVVLAWLAGASRRAAAIGWARNAWRHPRNQVLLLIGLAAVAMAAIVVAPTVLRRVTEGGEDLRATYVYIALRLFVLSPIVGTGPGTWVIQRIQQTQVSEVDYYIPHAHNIEAQTLAELGIVGALAGVVVVALLFVLVRGAIRDADPGRRRWGWLTALGLVYFALHQQFDFYGNMPAVLFAAALPVAYLDATAAPSTSPALRVGVLRIAPGWRRAAAIGMVLAIGLSVVGLAAQEGAAIENQRGIDAANAGDWASAATDFHDAAAADPDEMPYVFSDGLTQSDLGNHEAAASLFRRVAEASDLPEAWLDLAAEEALLGHRDEAISSIQASLRVGIQRPAIAVPAAALALSLNDADDARQALVGAVATTPSFAADPWWSSGPQRSLLKPVVEQAIAEIGPARGWEVALMSGDPQRAAALASNASAGQLVSDVIGAWSGDSAAAGQLFVDCREHPLDVVALGWCGRLERRLGHVDVANEYAYLANVIIGGAAASASDLRVDPTPSSARAPEGNLAFFWGTWGYRRGTPSDMLVPGLLHLKLE